MTSPLVKAAIAGLTILSFVPLLAAGPAVDAYARTRGAAALSAEVSAVAASIERRGLGLLGALDGILAAAPALCTPAFLDAATESRKAVSGLLGLVVTDPDGMSLCAVGRVPEGAEVLSPPIGIAGRSQSITLVRETGSDTLLIRVDDPFGAGTVIAYAALPASSSSDLLAALRPGATARVSLTNGTLAVMAGDWKGFEDRRADYIDAGSFAGGMPIRVDAAIPFAVVRADYADAYLVLMVLLVVIGALLCTLAIIKVRGTHWPQFDLERAIRNGEIKPYYQPVVNLMTGRVSGCEVLCRWEMRDGSVRGPGSFIEYAETTGLGIAMTLSVMKQVKKDLAELCRDFPAFTVSINLFDKHFADSRVVEDVRSIFGESPIRYSQLVFEITERHPLDRIADAHDVIVGFHQLGARVAMDDTGTGHSNLAYLQTLGVDVLKIDRVFIDMILPGTTSVPVLDGLIRMARDLNTDVVAEGIETEEQLHYLKARGITEAQGYLFSPALRAEPFCRLVRALNAPRVSGGPSSFVAGESAVSSVAISAA